MYATGNTSKKKKINFKTALSWKIWCAWKRRSFLHFTSSLCCFKKSFHRAASMKFIHVAWQWNWFVMWFVTVFYKVTITDRPARACGVGRHPKTKSPVLETKLDHVHNYATTVSTELNYSLFLSKGKIITVIMGNVKIQDCVCTDISYETSVMQCHLPDWQIFSPP